MANGYLDITLSLQISVQRKLIYVSSASDKQNY